MSGMPTKQTSAPGTLPRAALGVLADRLTGRVLTRHDHDYADAVTMFNASVTNRPDVVVQPRSTADVATAVRFAREQGLELSVKGGGHGVAGLATAGRLCIDVGGMRAVTVDAAARRATVLGGATWAEVDEATQRVGLATPGGRVTHTGVAGLTLGGGQGWLSPRHGLSCDNLLAAEVVTADGDAVVAGPGGDEDLLWALRGGGGGFGVVTRFEYALHEVGPAVLGGIVVHPIGLAEEVMGGYAELVETAGPDLGGAVVLATAPPAPFIPPDLVGAPVVITTLAWFGDLADGARRLAPLRRLGPPVADLVEPMPYAVLQTLTDAPNPRGMRNYWSAGYVADVPGDLVRTLVAAAATKSSPLTALVVLQMGEAVNAVPEEATAFPRRDARWLVHPVGMWADPELDESETAWVRTTKAAMRSWETGGTYLNTDSAQADQEQVQAAFTSPSRARLAHVKAAYDPENVFRYAPQVTG